jgi:serine/threonine protein kinase
MDSIVGSIDDKYNLVKLLGEGATAKVYKAYKTDEHNGEPYAIKVLAEDDTKNFRTEVDLLSKIKHQNVVKIVDMGKGKMITSNGDSERVLYVVLELLENGEFFDFIFFINEIFGEENGKLLFAQILEGVDACHKAGIVHRDLKNENIMVSSDFVLKVADFGYATKMEGESGNGVLRTKLGTKNYCPPELLLDKPYYGVPNDVFCLGVLLFIIVTRKAPFCKASKIDPYYRYIYHNDFTGYWNALSKSVGSISDEFKDLMVKLICYEPLNRLTIEEIKAHPWIKNVYEDPNIGIRQYNLLTEMKKRQVFMEEKKQKDLEASTKFGGTAAYRGGDEFVDCDSRVMNEYVPSSNMYTVFITNADADGKKVCEELNRYLKLRGATTNISDDTFSITAVFNDDQIKEEGEEKEEDEIVNENPDIVTDEILKISAEVKNDVANNRLVVEFKKLEGDRLNFFRIYEEFSA